MNVHDRHIHRRLRHVIEHIENGSYWMAITILKEIITEDEQKIRKGDKNG